MNDNIENMIQTASITELEGIVEQAKKQIEERREEEINNARIQVRELAASLDITLEELLMEPKGAKVHRKAVIKYRNPSDEAQTWTGRGKQPNWITKALEGGAKLEDFLV